MKYPTARFLDPPQTPIEGHSGYELSPDTMVKSQTRVRIASKWRAFLLGPRLQFGVALLILVVVSLLCWGGLFVGIHFFRHL